MSSSIRRPRSACLRSRSSTPRQACSAASVASRTARSASTTSRSALARRGDPAPLGEVVGAGRPRIPAHPSRPPRRPPLSSPAHPSRPSRRPPRSSPAHPSRPSRRPPRSSPAHPSRPLRRPPHRRRPGPRGRAPPAGSEAGVLYRRGQSPSQHRVGGGGVGQRRLQGLLQLPGDLLADPLPVLTGQLPGLPRQFVHDPAALLGQLAQLTAVQTLLRQLQLYAEFGQRPQGFRPLPGEQVGQPGRWTVGLRSSWMCLASSLSPPALALLLPLRPNGGELGQLEVRYSSAVNGLEVHPNRLQRGDFGLDRLHSVLSDHAAGHAHDLGRGQCSSPSRSSGST